MYTPPHFVRNFAFVAAIFSFQMAFSQQGAKWGTGGNSVSTGDFIGTTNNFSLLFKVNNIQRMSLNTTGILQLNSLAGTGTGFTTLDANGNLIRTNFPNDPNKFLNGNGTFSTITTLGSWSYNGNNIFNPNSGFVGIGTNNPQFILDVNGDARVNGTLYAQGIVLATKMQADTMKSGSMVADTLTSASVVTAIMTSANVVAGTVKSSGMISINNNLNFAGGLQNEIYTYNGDVRMQSFPGYNGNTILNAGTNGNVGVGIYSPQYKFDVNGDVRLNGKTHVYRIVPLPGDSLIRFGDSTIYLNTSQNMLSANPIGQFKGLGIGFGINHPYGNGSITIGTKVGVDNLGTNSIVIGRGALTGPILNNNKPYSLMIGFNSDLPTLFVSPADGVGTTGGVCIGDTHIPEGFKLAVNGKIIAEEVQVKLRGFWPDTVFSSSYSLMPIPELTAYVNREHHLPGVPSAQQVQQKQSFGVGEMEVTLLQKVEELTLYMIQLKQQNDVMQLQNAEMQKEIEDLKKKQ